MPTDYLWWHRADKLYDPAGDRWEDLSLREHHSGVGATREVEDDGRVYAEYDLDVETEAAPGWERWLKEGGDLADFTLAVAFRPSEAAMSGAHNLVDLSGQGATGLRINLVDGGWEVDSPGRDYFHAEGGAGLAAGRTSVALFRYSAATGRGELFVDGELQAWSAKGNIKNMDGRGWLHKLEPQEFAGALRGLRGRLARSGSGKREAGKQAAAFIEALQGLRDGGLRGAILAALGGQTSAAGAEGVFVWYGEVILYGRALDGWKADALEDYLVAKYWDYDDPPPGYDVSTNRFLKDDAPPDGIPDDSDGDGVPDYVDTDGDGIPDIDEVGDVTDPNDPTDKICNYTGCVTIGSGAWQLDLVWEDADGAEQRTRVGLSGYDFGAPWTGHGQPDYTWMIEPNIAALFPDATVSTNWNRTARELCVTINGAEQRALRLEETRAGPASGDFARSDCRDANDAAFSCDPAGWWKLDETTDGFESYGAADSSGAELHSAMNFEIYDDLDGVHGSAASFDDDESSLGLPAAALDGAAAGTIAFWVRSTKTELQHVIRSYQPDGAWAHVLRLQLDQGRIVYRRDRQDNKSAIKASGTALGDGAWHHVAVAWDADGDRLDMFIDGVAAGDRTGTGTVAPIALHGSRPITIGQKWENDGSRPAPPFAERFVGSLDDLRIHPCALSAEEIAAIMAGGDAPASEAPEDVMLSAPPCDATAATLFLPDVAENRGYHGFSADVEGEWAVVGSMKDDTAGTNNGSVHLYRSHSGTGAWERFTEIAEAEAAPGGWFGMGSDLGYAPDGATPRLIVGSPWGARDAAFVYEFDAETESWKRLGGKLTPHDGGAGGIFGYSVAVRRDVAVVGDHQDDEAATDAGALWVYRIVDGAWEPMGGKIMAPATIAHPADYLGRTVSLTSNPDTGAPRVAAGMQNRSGGAGCVLVFEWNEATTTWEPMGAPVRPSDGYEGDWFGSVSIDGDRLVAGMRDAGRVYVYDWDGSAWVEVRLPDPDGGPPATLGASVNVSGDRIVAGGGSSGGIHLWERDAGGWRWLGALGGGESHGWPVRTDGQTVIAGNYHGGTAGVYQAGQAHLYANAFCALGGANPLPCVDEGAEQPWVVGVLGASDPDGDDELISYEIADSSAPGAFYIHYNWETGAYELRVDDGTLLDYETATEHGVLIRATDESGAFTDTPFLISVCDVEGPDPQDPIIFTCLPAGWWRLDESAGTSAADSGGDGLDGALVGSAAWEPGEGPNDEPALRLGDGAYDRVLLPPAALNGATDLTVAYWVRSPKTSRQSILSAARAGQANEFLLYYPSGSTLAVYDGGRAINLGAGGEHDGDWHHVAVVRDAQNGELRRYVDGELVGSASVALPALRVDAGGLLLGQDQDRVGGGFQGGRQRFVGHLSDLRIHPCALSPEDIAAAMEGQDPTYEGDDCTPVEEMVGEPCEAGPTVETCDYEGGVSHDNFNQTDGVRVGDGTYSIWIGYEDGGIERFALVAGTGADVGLLSNYTRFKSIMLERIQALAPEAQVDVGYDDGLETMSVVILGSQTRFTRLIVGLWLGFDVVPTPDASEDIVQSNCRAIPDPSGTPLTAERWKIDECDATGAPLTRWEWRIGGAPVADPALLAQIIASCGPPEQCEDSAVMVEEVAYQDSVRVCNYDACIISSEFGTKTWSLRAHYLRDGTEETIGLSSQAFYTLDAAYNIPGRGDAWYDNSFNAKLRYADANLTSDFNWDAATNTVCINIINSSVEFTRLTVLDARSGALADELQFTQSNCRNEPIPGAPITNYERWEIVDGTTCETHCEWRRADGAPITQAEMDMLGDPDCDDPDPVNQPPIAQDDAYATPEDQALSGNVIASPIGGGPDSDPDGDALSATLVSGPTHGTLTTALQPDGSFTYTPAQDYNGTDSFTYSISDGNGGTDTATVAITITPVNDPPLAVDNGPIAIAKNSGAISVLVLNNDEDPDIATNGDTLTIISVSPVSASGPGPLLDGTAVINGSAIDFTPRNGFTGTATFTYTIEDAAGETSTAIVTIVVSDTPNQPPVAQPDDFTMDEGDATFAGNVITSAPDGGGPDSDPNEADGDTITAILDDDIPVGQGTLDFSDDGSFIYTPPDADFNGEVSFTYHVEDNHGASSGIATVTITVNPTNDDPVAEDDTFFVSENSVANLLAVLTNANPNGPDHDPDADDTISISIFDTATREGGILTRSGSTILYTPPVGFTGEDGFSYTISDGNGGTDSAQVTIHVGAAVPVALDDAFETTEDAATQTWSVLTNAVGGTDTDPDDTINVPASGHSVALTDPGALPDRVDWLGDGTFTYTPPTDLGSTLELTFDYNLTDPEGNSDTATVTITVLPRNDPPVAQDDAFIIAEDPDLPLSASVITSIPDGGGRDSDPDSDQLTATLLTDSVTIPGLTWSAANDGTFTYMPPPDFHGEVRFQYQVSDGNGGTATAEVSITVLPVNDAPILAPLPDPPAGVANFTAIKGFDYPAPILPANSVPIVSDVDNPLAADSHSVAVLSGPDTIGTFSIAPDGSLVFAPSTDAEIGTYTITLQVSDEMGPANNELSVDTITITVEIIDQPNLEICIGRIDGEDAP